MEKNTEELLQFLYLSPIGLCESNLEGKINHCNAIACNYLIAISKSSELHNIFDLLNLGKVDLGSDCKKLMDDFKGKEGFLIKNKRVDFYKDDEKLHFIMAITIRKISTNQFMWVFQDITEITRINKEKEILIERESFQNGQVKLMESVIHNIGNTITNLTLGVKVIQDNQTLESFNLVSKLLDLFKNYEEELKTVFKEKNEDIISFLDTFKSSLKEEHDQNTQRLSSLKSKINQTEQIIQMYRRRIKSDPIHTIDEKSNINDILQNALNLTENQREKFKIDIELALSKENFMVEKYSTDLFQVFLNILDNSYDSLKKRKENDESFKKGIIKVSSGWTTDKNSFFITIEDNGIGFSKEEETLLFSRGKTFKDNHEGLGLFYVREVTDLIQGTISFKSPGTNLGATFKISFPKKDKGRN